MLADLPLVLASELGITTGGTSKLVDRIEASGYCRRQPNPAGRRSSLLELTPAGRRMLPEAGVAFDEELQRWPSSAMPERTLHAHPPARRRSPH